MAARRGKSQARRSGGGNSGLPGWAWLVIGVLIALVAVLAAPKFIGDGQKGEGGFFRIGGPQPNPDAQPKGGHEPDGTFDPATATRTPQPMPPAKTTAEKPTGFDFYEVLPGEEVAMTDAQLAAMQKEEARRQAAADAAAKAASQDAASQAADAHARAVAAASGQALPRPINESGAQSAPTGSPPTVPPPAPPAPQAARAETAARPANATPYILQAGAFQANGDAEATKARIALLGLNARVESADVGGKTVFRVRMGPYASATELADAKQKLANGGLSAVAIKSK